MAAAVHQGGLDRALLPAIVFLLLFVGVVTPMPSAATPRMLAGMSPTAGVPVSAPTIGTVGAGSTSFGPGWSGSITTSAPALNVGVRPAASGSPVVTSGVEAACYLNCSTISLSPDTGVVAPTLNLVVLEVTDFNETPGHPLTAAAISGLDEYPGTWVERGTPITQPTGLVAPYANMTQYEFVAVAVVTSPDADVVTVNLTASGTTTTAAGMLIFEVRNVVDSNRTVPWEVSSPASATGSTVTPIGPALSVQNCSLVLGLFSLRGVGTWGGSLPIGPGVGLTADPVSASASFPIVGAWAEYAVLPAGLYNLSASVGTGGSQWWWSLLEEEIGPFACPTSLARYALTFSESGLSPGTDWYVNITGGPSLNTTSTSISTSLPNWTYRYATSTAYHAYHAPGGSVAVNGSPAGVSIAFQATDYAVAFLESGLPPDTIWNVTVTGFGSESGLGGAIGFDLPNGTYSYTPVSANPIWWSAPGTFQVVGGPTDIGVPFVVPNETIVFTESGLPVGKDWSVAVDAIAETAVAGQPIAFSEPFGTHAYLVHSAGSFRVSGLPPEGTFVANSIYSRSMTVGFVTGRTYAISWHEVGLQAGTTWCVDVGGRVCSATPTISLKHLTPGNYTYSVAPFGGMTTIVRVGTSWTSTNSGSLVIASAGAIVQVRFAFAVTFTETGLAGGTLWTVSSQGMTVSSTTSTLVLFLTNGTHVFSIHAVAGYGRSPATGRILVPGTPVTRAVTFTVRL